MKHNQISKFIYITCITIFFMLCTTFSTCAASEFDPDYYAATYSDVVMVLGTEPQVLYDHYLTYGMEEGRVPYEGAKPGIAVEGILGYVDETTNDSKGTSAQFDPQYYAMSYPVTAMIYGGDPEGLYVNYIVYGMEEGRVPYEGAEPGAPVSGIVGFEANVEDFKPVSIDQLANLSSLRKKMTDEEFTQAYNVALEVVKPFSILSRKVQLYGIMMSLTDKFGGVYSMDAPHYNDPYGYFILHVASCAGSTRAIGLCLNILDIPYEHVNENQYQHQWCRVEINGTYWICDEFGIYCGPEPAPYMHPRFED